MKPPDVNSNAFGLSIDDDDIVYTPKQNQQTSYGNILDGFTNILGNGWNYVKSGLSSLTTPFGTGKNSKNGLDYLSDFGSLAFDWWKTNKQLDYMKDGLKTQKQLAVGNLSNQISTQGANAGQLALMAKGWSDDYGKQVASNYSAMMQNGANTISALGGDASGIQNQIANLNKLVG